MNERITLQWYARRMVNGLKCNEIQQANCFAIQIDRHEHISNESEKDKQNKAKNENKTKNTEQNEKKCTTVDRNVA